ncbi:MAG: GGDEF domain-containing protein [Solirubrobacterales bacterium]|nr:GGDEF domain-containing protein [Solirubrobacterales bacterium]
MGESDLTWRRLFSIGSAELYSIMDAERVRRTGGIFWVCGALIAALILPFAPPDESSAGDAGWILAGAIVAGSGVAGLVMLRGSAIVRSGWQTMLAASYLGIALATVLNWLAGPDAPYSGLLLIGAIFVASAFPPRVLPAYMVVVGVALLVPLAWGADVLVIDQVARLLIWTGLGLGVAILLTRQRLEQAELKLRGDEEFQLARADPLTGLGNRRAFDEALAIAGSRAGRTDRAVSVIVADVEGFKSINDGHGLIAGDRLLRDVADAIAGSVRAPDACFRWGGDEFVIIADVDAEDAAAFAERLDAAVADACRRPDGTPVRLHVGVAELDRAGGDAAEILNAASRAMKPASRRRG